MTNPAESKQPVCVLGAGAMGHGIAQAFALAGFKVRLFDPDRKALETAPKRIAKSLAVFQELGLVDGAGLRACLGNLEASPDMARACRGCQVVVEAAPESLELKRGLLARAQGLASAGAVLCTNTSALRITELAAGLKRPERLVGTHFWNPPQVMPCVEVVSGRETSREAFEQAVELMRRLGKEPVRVLKDAPGFLGNRLQHALQREALSLVEQGLAAPEDVDRVVKHGFGLRLALMGPLERADIGGLDVTLAVQEYLLPHLDNRAEASPLLAQKVREGRLGVKTGRGFYSWSGEGRTRLLARRERLLLKIIALLNEEA